MAFNFGSFAPQGNSTQTPLSRDPWGMLTNVGMGMLANSQYNPGTALGKGWEAAQGQQLEAAKANALFEEQDRKKRADQQQQAFTQQLQQGLAGAQQPIPQAGAAVAPPPPPIAAPSLGVGDTGPNMGAVNPAAANAANAMAVNNMSGAIPTPPTQPGPSPGGVMPMPAAPPPGAGMQAGGGEGTMNVFGLNVTPQQVAESRIWLAQNDTTKAIEALTRGDPNKTEALKNFHAYVQDEVKSGRTPMGFLQYQQALRAPAVSLSNIGNQGPAESALKKKYGEEMGTILAENVNQGMKAGETKGLMQTYMELQKASGNSGQFDALREKLGPWAKMIGIDVDMSKLSAAQAMEAITNKMAPALRVKGSGNTSDRDILLFLNSLPQLQNTPEGNALIASTLDSVAEAQIKGAEISQQIVDGEITMKEGMKQIRELNPYAGFKEKAAQYGVDMSGKSTAPKQEEKSKAPYFDLKTRKLIRPGTTSSNERFGAYGTSGGIRG